MTTFRWVALAVLTAALVLLAGIIFGWTDPASAEFASFYGREHHGRKTANGERFNMHAMTAAHRTLPFGTRLRVCRNGCVLVKVNDRGPFIRGRSIDLSSAAARAIGLSNSVGVGRVSIERIGR